jgi:hypothetical protein
MVDVSYRPDYHRDAEEEPEMNILDNIDDEFARYFHKLGYAVTWDFAKRGRRRWYEIFDGGRLVA